MKEKLFFAWSVFCVLGVAAVSFAWWDPADPVLSSLNLVAAVTGVLYTLLAGRGRMLSFAFGFVNAPLYAYLSWRWGYYGDMALNVYYSVMMIPGFVCWRRHLQDDPSSGIVRTRLAARERIVWAAAIAAAAAALWWILTRCHGNRPFCDALTNVLSIAAMILTVKRCIEQWVMWLAVDAIEVFMWWQTGATSWPILAMWLIFLIDGTYSFALWISAMRKVPTRGIMV